MSTTKRLEEIQDRRDKLNKEITVCEDSIKNLTLNLEAIEKTIPELRVKAFPSKGVRIEEDARKFEELLKTKNTNKKIIRSMEDDIDHLNKTISSLNALKYSIDSYLKKVELDKEYTIIGLSTSGIDVGLLEIAIIRVNDGEASFSYEALNPEESEIFLRSRENVDRVVIFDRENDLQVMEDAGFIIPSLSDDEHNIVAIQHLLRHDTNFEKRDFDYYVTNYVEKRFEELQVYNLASIYLTAIGITGDE